MDKEKVGRQYDTEVVKDQIVKGIVDHELKQYFIVDEMLLQEFLKGTTSMT